jgi:hypothetical protein
VSFDATVTTSATSKPNVEVSGEKVAAKYYKNGTSIKILTIPDPTDTNNPFNIRIYNMGATDAGVYGTLYNTKGQLIGTANTLLSTLKPKAVKVMKATDLGTLFGVTTWGAGRAWLQIEGDSQQIRAQAYAKTGGVLVNMSDRVIEDSGTFKRADTQ